MKTAKPLRTGFLLKIGVHARPCTITLSKSE